MYQYLFKKKIRVSKERKKKKKREKLDYFETLCTRVEELVFRSKGNWPREGIYLFTNNKK